MHNQLEKLTDRAEIGTGNNQGRIRGLWFAQFCFRPKNGGPDHRVLVIKRAIFGEALVTRALELVFALVDMKDIKRNTGAIRMATAMQH